MNITIVIPCYNSEHTIEKVVDMIVEEFDKQDRYRCDFVLANDYSKDGTFDAIRRLGKKYPFVKGINLMRNFGQHNALMAALYYASGDLILGMDDDMQTHPSQIFKLIHKIEEGYDLVYGVYKKLKNSFFKNLSSRFNTVTSRILLGRPKEITSSNYWIITKQVRDEVIKYKNFNPYVDGIFYKITTNIGNVEVEHHKREYGNSNYTFRRLVRLWMAYLNFSTVPLRISTYLGVFSAIAGFIGAIVTFIKKLIHPSLQMGWASIMCCLFIFAGVILLILGIIGEYLGKVTLAINGTPQYIIRETVNLEEKEEGDSL